MATKFDTKDWAINATVGYVLKSHARKYVECPRCRGTGVIGGGPLGPEEERCPECRGRREVHDGYVAEPEPELPRGLVDALRTTLEGHEPPSHVISGDWHPV